MQTRKREYNTNVPEKVESPAKVKEKAEEHSPKPVRCVSCAKIIAEVEEVIAGRMLVKCGHCGTRNSLDHSTNYTRTGRQVY